MNAILIWILCGITVMPENYHAIVFFLILTGKENP